MHLIVSRGSGAGGVSIKVPVATLTATRRIIAGAPCITPARPARFEVGRLAQLFTNPARPPARAPTPPPAGRPAPRRGKPHIKQPPTQLVEHVEHQQALPVHQAPSLQLVVGVHVRTVGRRVAARHAPALPHADAIVGHGSCVLAASCCRSCCQAKGAAAGGRGAARYRSVQ
jgi:hypothetical protein